MSMEERDVRLPPEMEARLDGLLEAWAVKARLSPERAEEIRDAALNDSTGSADDMPFPVLGYEWWRDLLRPAATALALSARDPMIPGAPDLSEAPTAWLIQSR
jgi:hypothetical protein